MNVQEFCPKTWKILVRFPSPAPVLTTNNEDQLTSFKTIEGSVETPVSITYDSDFIGKPVQIGNKNLIWEGRKLKEISNENIAYTYNEQGIRISKNVDGVITKYYLKGKNIIAEETNGIKTYFIYNDENQLIGFEYQGNYYFYERDLLGNIQKIIDTSGSVMVTYKYDAWGNWINKSSASNGTPLGDTLLSVNPFIYKGYYYDNETNWYYCKSRYYDSYTSHYISINKISNISPNKLLGLNLFKYACDSPVFISHNTESLARTYGIQSISKIVSSGSGALEISNGRDISPLPEWLSVLSTVTDYTASIVSPFRTAFFIFQDLDIWDLMREDGISELPGNLSKAMSIVGYGLAVLGGVMTGYEKYQSGASLTSSITGGLISVGISIGSIYATSAITSSIMAGFFTGTGALFAGFAAASPIGVIVIGVVVAIGVGLAVNYVLTKLEIGGNTVEGHINNLVDWITWWD